MMAVMWVVLAAWVIQSEGWPGEPILWIAGGGISAITLGVSIAIGFGIAAWIGSGLPQRMDSAPFYTAKLVSIRSGDGVTGSITGGAFLIVGHIGTEQYYFWYEQSGDSVTPRQKPVGVGTYVYDEDRHDAEFQQFAWHFTQSWWRLFAFDPGGTTNHFHVPKGTVSRTFQLQ
jgi:hypothetical protein